MGDKEKKERKKMDEDHKKMIYEHVGSSNDFLWYVLEKKMLLEYLIYQKQMVLF